MKLVVDMNLSPGWIPILEHEGWPAVHWSDVGAHNATDRRILEWAQDNEHCILTHDLDFGAILAAGGYRSPSVVQIRTQNLAPDALANLMLDVLRQYESEIESGALLVVDESALRVRLLPLRGNT
ncbi:MAG: hypothetical protein AMXMBFR82_18380 [Candidatus Hydrogenedentota bacterium]